MQNGLLADVLVKYMLHEDNVNLARTSDPEVSERSERASLDEDEKYIRASTNQHYSQLFGSSPPP